MNVLGVEAKHGGKLFFINVFAPFQWGLSIHHHRSPIFRDSETIITLTVHCRIESVEQCCSIFCMPDIMWVGLMCGGRFLLVLVAVTMIAGDEA